MRRAARPFRLLMTRRSQWLVRSVCVALLLALGLTLPGDRSTSIAGRAADGAAQLAARAVGYARGLARTDTTTEALDPKVARQTAAYVAQPQGPVAPGA